ncbi:MAG TPA: hypothetical protein HPP83_07805, partial [Candidatus Hydrogenedentes bacterium]|nr:hypothetical protein [Candidatus Hydrogenedentota bacterium]
MSRRIDLLLCGLFAAATITGAAAAPLPAELANIAQLAENEQRLARTVRDYDLLQQWLCDWDIALAQQHSAAGD